MALSREQKEVVVKQFQRRELDTGSSEVQVALLTARINELTGHFKLNKNDVHSQRGLIKLVSRRRKLLDYLKSRQPETYTKLISDLSLRK